MINKKRLIKTFSDLVKIDSESRNEIDVAVYIKNKLKKLGIKYKIDNSNKSFGLNKTLAGPPKLNQLYFESFSFS